MLRRFLAQGSRQVRRAAAAAQNPDSSTPKGYSFKVVAAVGALGVVGGTVLGDHDARLRRMVLPSGSFRSCCDVALTDTQKQLGAKLGSIAGSGHVKHNYRLKGARLGSGTALAYVQPGTLKEAVEVLQACVDAGVAIIPQGANTALTGGSVPRDQEVDRPTVIINLRRLNKILPIGDAAEQVLCFSGAGIYDLSQVLANKFNRDSHSVLGSIFLNPSVGAGVAFGSGGTQIRKGPAWTERALFCKVDDKGEVQLINTLGLKLDGDVLELLEARDSLAVSDLDSSCTACASWPKYAENLRKHDSNVARYNADCTGPDCCRSEGKVMILATLHDTYEQPKSNQLLWVSCRDLATVHALRQQVALLSGETMAKSCEYMNRPVYEGVSRAGLIMVKVIDLLGMHRLEPLWNIKLFVESIPLPFTNIICDKFLYWFNGLIPHPLPVAVQDLAKEYEHHVLMEFAEYSDGEVGRLTAALDKLVASSPEGAVKYYICKDKKEVNRASFFRFVVASSFRTYVVGKGLQGLSIDYALPKNFTEYPILPEEKYPVEERWIYSHLGCNVYHEDLAFKPDVDVEVGRYEIKHAVEDTGGKLPAEHGHGTEYPAPKAMQERWMKTDPLNVMNPGVGHTSCNKLYAKGHAHAVH